MVITNFYGRFVSVFLLAYCWVRLKPFRQPVVEFFDKGVGFSWRAYRDFSSGFICVDSAMGPFLGTTRTNSPLTAFNERGIIDLVATNAGWLPYAMFIISLIKQGGSLGLIKTYPMTSLLS